MKAPVQFIVLKRADKWFVKWQDAERIFPVQHKAVEAAIKLANDSGKNGKPAVVLFKRSKNDFRKFGPTARATYPPTKSDLAVNAQVTQARKPSGPATPATEDGAAGRCQRSFTTTRKPRR
jgi:hypothetical protein